MIEDREETYHGVWFLPGSETNVQGHLKVTNFTIELHLTDPNDRHLVKELALNDIGEEKYPIIYGLGQYGEKITLYDCSGFSNSFDAKLMLYGDNHYEHFDTQKFKILGVHIPYFDSWISDNSFNKIIDEAGFSIVYNTPEKILIELSEKIELKIDFECFAPQTEQRVKIILHQFALVNFVAKDADGMTLSELFKYLLYFQQLVSLLARDGANISAARVYNDYNQYRNNKFLGTMIYGNMPFNKFEFPPENRHRNYLINKADLNGNITNFITKWFNFAAEAQHILNLIFLDYFYRGAFDENNFLNLIRVLEIYHIYKYPGRQMPDEEFKLKLKEIIEAIPEKYKSEVKEHLAHKNELTLDQRLAKLFSEVETGNLGFDYKYDDAFKLKVKHSRNYYTHYNPKLKSKAATGEDLEFLAASCRALINYLLLKHLDVPEAVLRNKFQFYIESSYYSNYFL